MRDICTLSAFLGLLQVSPYCYCSKWPETEELLQTRGACQPSSKQSADAFTAEASGHCEFYLFIPAPELEEEGPCLHSAHAHYTTISEAAPPQVQRVIPSLCAVAGLTLLGSHDLLLTPVLQWALLRSQWGPRIQGWRLVGRWWSADSRSSQDPQPRTGGQTSRPLDEE